MCSCKDLGIPEHLWRKGRPNVINFDRDELLFRRFTASVPPFNSTTPYNHTQEINAFTGEIFQLNQDSYNRSKFCKCPEDVLINEFGDIKINHGIFEIAALDFFFSFEANINGKIEVINVSVEHDGLECNYSHSIFKYTISGEDPKLPTKSKIIKNMVRTQLFPKIKVLKQSIS